MNRDFVLLHHQTDLRIALARVGLRVAFKAQEVGLVMLQKVREHLVGRALEHT